MAKSLAFSCALLAIGCSSQEFVIGRYVRDDASVADAPTPAPSTDECSDDYADALVCSGFETSSLRDEWSELIYMGDSELERTTERAHGGEHALRAESTASASRAAIVASFPARRSGELFLRAYLFVPEGLPTGIMNIFFFGDDARRYDDFEGVDLNIQEGALQVFIPQHDPGRFTGEALIPRGEWFCFRAQVVLSDDAGGVKAYAGEQLLVEVADVDTVPAGGVRQFRAGIDWSSEQEEFFELFIDDLVVDDAPVACL